MQFKKIELSFVDALKNTICSGPNDGSANVLKSEHSAQFMKLEVCVQNIRERMEMFRAKSLFLCEQCIM